MPTHDDWEELAEYINSADGTFTKSSYSWQDIGKLLKATSGWNDDNGKSGNGTDNYDFSALPGGRRIDNSFINAGYGGSWWSCSAENSLDVWHRSLEFHTANFNRGDWDWDIQNLGFSVRCVRD